jgi:hypothetical protein
VCRRRGQLLTAFIVCYSLTGFIAGYASGGFYARNGGKVDHLLLFRVFVVSVDVCCALRVLEIISFVNCAFDI